jgi:hypothetical protein
MTGTHAPLAIKAAAVDGTTLISGTVAPVAPPLVLSYVTTLAGGTTAVLHLHASPELTKPAALQRILFDGQLVDTGKLVVLGPGGHAVFVTDLPAPKAHGEVWTAVLFTDASGAAGAAYGGRILPERYPVQTWPHTEDCPLPQPNVSNPNATELRDIGIDSIFQGFGRFAQKCAPPGLNKSQAAVAYVSTLEGVAADGWWHVMLDGENAGQWKNNALLSPGTRAEVVDGILIGDEVDGSGIKAKNLRPKLNLSLENIRATPDLLTYQGSATNAFVGAFAGIADIQGSDAYAAACAPSQANRVSLQYPYQYLRNARDNHIPGTFWGYSQLFNGPDGSSHVGAADTSSLSGSRVRSESGWNYEPNPNELVCQIAQTVLAGSKALMLFQTEHSQLSTHNMSLVRQTIRSMRTVSEVIRTGDIGGVLFDVSSKL